MEMNGQTRGRHSFSSRGRERERDSGVEAQRQGFIKLGESTQCLHGLIHILIAKSVRSFLQNI